MAEATAKEIEDAMVNLFDKRESVFARRYAALQIEWKGDDHEQTTTFFARLHREVANFELKTFKDDQLGTLLLLLAMRSPSLDKLRTLVLTKLRESPEMALSQCEDLIRDHLATALEQKLPEQPNIMQVNHRDFHQKRKPKHQRKHSLEEQESLCCYRCGGKHSAEGCRFRNAECHGCGREGHIVRMCQGPIEKNAPEFQQVECAENESREGCRSIFFNSCTVKSKRSKNQQRKKRLPCLLNDRKVLLEIDTGADFTVLTRKDYAALGSPVLQQRSTTAKGVGDLPFKLDGSFEAKIQAASREARVKVFVAKTPVSLLGLNAFNALQLGNIPLNDIISQGAHRKQR
ncbi:hypothetical protein NEOKW01_2156, partial [Nematocida sp. AWRm80]